MSDIQELLNRVRERAGTDDPELLNLVARVAQTATILVARAAVGEDVEREMAHLKAQTSNLSADLLNDTTEVLREWILEKILIVIAGIATA